MNEITKNVPIASVKLLDCTLRDGGYYNNWDFDTDLVKDYLNAMAKVGVDYVEIGMRSGINEDFKGGFAFSTDQFLRTLDIPSGLLNKLAVMINASEFLCANELDLIKLEKLFDEAEKSPVSLVRVACHIEQFENALPIAKILFSKGYKVAFNLMQISEISFDVLEGLIKKAKLYPIDILYIADSIGCLMPEEIKRIVAFIKNLWNRDIGIHTHDNLTQALQNTLTAIDSGVSWVDGTVMGMGRGPGNAAIEYLIQQIKNEYEIKSGITSLTKLIRDHFVNLRNKYKWGTNTFYFMAGKNKIHPTYIQSILNDERFNDEDIMAVLGYLKDNEGVRYINNKLDSARLIYPGNVTGSWSPIDIFNKKDVLLLGTGPALKKYQSAIEDFIRSRNLIVLSLNAQYTINEELIDYRIACHPVRLLADCEAHIKLNQPLIAPLSMMTNQIKEKLKGKRVLDFGLEVKIGEFSFNNYYCTVPNSLVFSYSLATLYAGGAKKIYMAGFDGFTEGDPRKKEIDLTLDLFGCIENCSELVSLTPTLFDIKTKSVFGHN